MKRLNKRSSGVLMPISSLCGDMGIGTLGKSAYEFVDFLKKAGQTYWQILPVCPTGFGDSPYQSFSTFAGNPYFIDLEILEKEGYLSKEDYQYAFWSAREDKIDYSILYTERKRLFNKLFARFEENVPADFYKFDAENAFWLDDYARFMAIKDKFSGASFDVWDISLRQRTPDALKTIDITCQKSILYHKMLQFFFFRQWKALKKYANENGIKIIGDLPIYVSADSADVWSDPLQFNLNEDLRPVEVAGCPPDAFSGEGQLWGNPVYNWDYMKKTGYAWWKKRLEMSFKIYDVVRIDHFRAFDSYYCVPFGAKTAQMGVWREGPKMDFFDSIRESLGDLDIIAEDLGFLTDSVRKLLKDSTFPGMKVLQFAFDSDEHNEYLPHNYIRNSVVYTGTHDNDTVIGWANTMDEKTYNHAVKYLQATDRRDLAGKMILSALSSVCDTCILTVQDLLSLDSRARLNSPATVGENWKWRMTKEEFRSLDSQKLLDLTKLYGRLP